MIYDVVSLELWTSEHHTAGSPVNALSVQIIELGFFCFNQRKVSECLQELGILTVC